VTYKNLQPSERTLGERTLAVELLNYISQYGTTRGINRILGVWYSSGVTALKKLLRTGYVRKLGNARFEVTDKGWEYLSGEDLPTYTMSPLSEQYTERQLSKLRKGCSAKLLRVLKDSGVDTEGLSTGEMEKAVDLLWHIAPAGSKSENLLGYYLGYLGNIEYKISKLESEHRMGEV